LSGDLKYPLVVKPYFSGSSLGVSIVGKEENLLPALEKALTFQDKVIVEEYIKGREITVGILEEEPLAVVEIISKNAYFDYFGGSNKLSYFSKNYIHHC